MARIIDLSIPIDATTPADPPFQVPSVVHVAHDEGAEMICGLFPGLTRDQLPDGKGWATDTLTLSTHNGTHLDAPWHFHPTMNGGERSWTIDEVPLDWCYRPGVKLDFRHLPDGHVATPQDIDAELDRIGYDLRPFDIVLVNTAAGAALGQPDYVDRGCGIGREATLHLLGKGVRVTGTDGWSWDAPFLHTARNFARTGDAALIWEGHKAGRDQAYCHLEKLTNLDTLPPFGFDVICLPVRIAGGSAGWTRAVAVLKT